MPLTPFGLKSPTTQCAILYGWSGERVQRQRQSESAEEHHHVACLCPYLFQIHVVRAPQPLSMKQRTLGRFGVIGLPCDSTTHLGRSSTATNSWPPRLSIPSRLVPPSNTFLSFTT